MAFEHISKPLARVIAKLADRYKANTEADFPEPQKPAAERESK